jgi:hypothetical protein
MSRRWGVWSVVGVALCATSVAAAPAGSGGTRSPAPLSPQVLQSFKQQARHLKLNHLSTATKGLIAAGLNESSARLKSFPTWQGSLTSAGTNYPFTMVGRNPRKGGETETDTSMILLSFVFEEFVDDQGNNIVIDSSGVVDDVVNSPNFVATRYANGFAQFSDAVQRASFFPVAKRDWHTSINQPRLLTPVTILVPFGASQVFVSNGKFIAFVSFDFLFSQINTILQLSDLRTDELPMLVSRNVSADVALGFHDAFDVQVGNKNGIQTYLYTSWFDADVIDPIFADATTITHEISEWMADPFVNNVVPEYVIPDSGGFCQNLLEVGDPIEFLPNQMMPVTVRGRLYHTQVETTVQWFSREVPSSAFESAYSWPDPTVLTAPSDPCPPAAQ